MNELITLFFQNLIVIGIGMAIFVCAFLSNMAFSLYENLSIKKEGWSWNKFWEGIAKAVAFIVGLSLLCLSVTAIPYFADKIGWVIPKDYADVFSDLAIVFVILSVSCSYVLKAFNTFKDILNYKNPPVEYEEPADLDFE